MHFDPREFMKFIFNPLLFFLCIFNLQSKNGLQNERFKSPITRDFPEHPESERSQILKENSKHLEKQNLAQLGSRKEFYLRENEVKMARSTGVGIGDERLESELIKFYTIKKKGQINKNICWSKFFFIPIWNFVALRIEGNPELLRNRIDRTN